MFSFSYFMYGDLAVISAGISTVKPNLGEKNARRKVRQCAASALIYLIWDENCKLSISKEKLKP